MKVLKFIGAALYGSLVANIIYWFFMWITPLMMNSGGGVWFVLWLLGSTFFIGIIISLSTLLATPLLLLCKNVPSARILPTISFVLCGIYSIIDLWRADGWNLSRVVLGVIITITILVTFGSQIGALYNAEIE